MIAWILYCAIAGALVAVAARCAEFVARTVRIPIRWIWVGALAVTFVLGAVAPLRQGSVTAHTGQETDIAIDGLQLQAGIEAVRRQLPPSATLIAAVAWGIASALLFGVVAAVNLRLRAARRRWPVAELHGKRVRVSPGTGPLVIGVRRPEIVVPRWILDRDPTEQRMILAHEVEHVRANDTLLLGGGVIAAALMPWNPAVWYMFSRLRLAVELDCDARVLRRGISAGSYGSLLLHVATQASPLRFGAPALAPSPSHLHQRILAMHPTVTRYARLRAGVVAAFGAAALLVACEAEMPTGTEIEALDVRAAEHGASRLMAHGSDTGALYVVDGREVTKLEALAIKAEDIASIEVVRGTSGPTKFVITIDAGAMQVDARGEGVVVDPGLHRPLQTTIELRHAQPHAPPLILIDGKRSTPIELHALDPKRIASIEVVKGRAAQSLPGYTPAELANGVIKVVTKRQ
jgi:hypothetical protein